MASITPQERNEITSLFIAMFDAAPGAQHLSAMVSAYEGGASMLSIAENLATKPEFQDVYPSFLTAQEFADRMVGNLLTPETPSGAKAWATSWIIGKLNAGVSPAAVLLEAVQALAATTNPNYDSAQAQLENNIEVSNYYSITQEQPSADLVTLQEVLDGVTADPASVDAAIAAIDANLVGEEFILTTGADDFPGTTGNDEFRALSLDDVFSAFDELDGGDGKDTFNIYSDGANNTGFPTNASVTDIEIINFNNTGLGYGPIDASNFVGATEINQIGVADDVNELGAGTAAGFKNLGGAINVNVADDAASAAVVFDAVEETSDLDVLASGTGTLSGVTLSGTLNDTNDDGKIAPLFFEILVGKDVEAVTLNASLNAQIDLNLDSNGKFIRSFDGSASTSSFDYDADDEVMHVKTGSGKDTVSLNSVFATGFTTASLMSGAGDDTLVVAVDDSGDFNATVTVDAGDGNDIIDIATVAVPATKTLSLNVTGGAGNDTIKLTAGIDSVTEADLIDGGAGTDFLVADGKTLVAEDYILLDEVLVGFDGIRFVNSAASIEADRMADYKVIEFHGGASTATDVAADQKLFSSVDIKAVAAGDEDAGKSYAGTLDITVTAAVNAEAHAETVNLAIIGQSNNDGVAGYIWVDLEGDSKTANVVLQSQTDTNGTASTADDVLDISSVYVFNSGTNTNKLATLTVSGNGYAYVENYDGRSLSTIDASGLNSTNVKGAPAEGLYLYTDNTKAETIKLGAGLDELDIFASTFKATDTIHGLKLVESTITPDTVDTAKSDAIDVGVVGFVKTEIVAGSLNLALTAAAASTDDALVFAFGGNTYIYGDSNADHVLDDADLLVKLVGTVDLDLLVDALN